VNLNATLIAQTIVFFLLAGFTMKFVWPPLIKALDERAKKIADGLAAAERGTLSLRDAESKAQQLEVEARNRGAEILAQAERRAAALIDEAKAAAKAEGDRIAAAARADLEGEVQRAREALRDQVAALAVASAEKILRREVDAKAHADLLAQLKQELR